MVKPWDRSRVQGSLGRLAGFRRSLSLSALRERTAAMPPSLASADISHASGSLVIIISTGSSGISANRFTGLNFGETVEGTDDDDDDGRRMERPGSAVISMLKANSSPIDDDDGNILSTVVVVGRP